MNYCEYLHHVGSDKADVPSCASICVRVHSPLATPGNCWSHEHDMGERGGGDNKENENKEHELMGRFSAPVAAHRNHKVLMSRFYSR